jgi:hypothetical protein
MAEAAINIVRLRSRLMVDPFMKGGETGKPPGEL